MDRKNFFQRDCLAWGLGLWLFGYILGIVFFGLMPQEMIGWFITPIGLVFTSIVLWKWVHVRSMADGVIIGLVWCILAVVLDYVFIVRLFHPQDGYYKLDVYLYYASAFLLPVIAASLRPGETPGLPD